MFEVLGVRLEESSSGALCCWQGGLSKVDQLLLDVYSQVQEPDGIYAAARSQKAASQLCLFEHEDAWDKALVGYDLLQVGEFTCVLRPLSYMVII